jgi:hypothetical protein
MPEDSRRIDRRGIAPECSGDVFPERSEIGTESVARTAAGCIRAQDVGRGYRAFREDDCGAERGAGERKLEASGTKDHARRYRLLNGPIGMRQEEVGVGKTHSQFTEENAAGFGKDVEVDPRSAKSADRREPRGDVGFAAGGPGGHGTAAKRQDGVRAAFRNW